MTLNTPGVVLDGAGRGRGRGRGSHVREINAAQMRSWDSVDWLNTFFFTSRRGDTNQTHVLKKSLRSIVKPHS